MLSRPVETHHFGDSVTENSVIACKANINKNIFEIKLLDSPIYYISNT